MCVLCVQVAKALNFDNTGNVMIRIRALGRLFTWLVLKRGRFFETGCLIGTGRLFLF